MSHSSIAVAFGLCVLFCEKSVLSEKENDEPNLDYGNTPCITENNVLGNCLYNEDCFENLTLRLRAGETLDFHEDCKPRQICCPGNPKFPLTPEFVSILKSLVSDIELNSSEVHLSKPESKSSENSQWNISRVILPSNCSTELINTRIVGGSRTIIGEFPWIALLEYESGNEVKLDCGGSLITNWHVLTAGHCIDEKVLKRYEYTLRSVRLGEWDTTSDPDCSEENKPLSSSPDLECAPKFLSIPIEKTHPHPFFNTRSFSKHHDIALVQLKRPIEPSKYVRPICLPTNDKISPWATTMGWGRTMTSIRSDKLLKVDLPLADRQDCESNYKKMNVTLIPSQLCFGGGSNGDSCDGDSGDPLIQIDYSDLDQPRFQIVGIVSMGPRNCGTRGLAGIYTKVYDYVPWIYEQFRSGVYS
ncbi:hypothetical protein QAD02_017155 [Eretmocerus hayati]|uniref:Uncharacterized protein n=1 Tax=Eretmocerus hayati TaxID=131215 RepID=A0ACC2PD34_9HYME|nr:hypothetical protein QAD02_017155 [Eretmocerus hayati]